MTDPPSSLPATDSRVDQGLALQVIDPTAPDAAAQMDRACRELGFFRIPADVVPAGVVQAASGAADAFFALSVEEKNAVGFPEPGYPYGYASFQLEKLAASLGQDSGPDLKETFSVGPDCLGPGWDADRSPAAELSPDDEAWIRASSLWPADPPELRPSWETCFRTLSQVAADLLAVMATALGLPRDYFEQMIDRHGSAMRALNYPALDGPTPTGSIRAGAHSDYGTLTILVTDDVPGLEVRRADGSWRAIEHVDDTYVVNLGDSIARWTNDRWRSTVHRVTTVSSEPRRSMAFFHMANWDATIECLPTCHGPDDPPRYQPVMAGPWLKEKFTRSVG